MSFYGVILYNEDKEAIEQEEHSENSTFKAMLKGGKTYTLVISDGSSKAEGSFSVSYEKTEYITDLKITKLPDKTTYVDGYYDYDYLDFTGLEMQATWSDGSISNFVYDNYSGNKIRDEYVSFSRSGKTVKISCGEASTSFDIEVVPNPVKSIEIAEDPEISITEYTHGEWKTMYNPETGFYDLRYYYYNVSNFFDDNIQIKINYIDGTSRTASINENVDGYSFWYSDNQYNTPWKIGKNKVNIGYLGKTTTFEVEIKESPVDYLLNRQQSIHMETGIHVITMKQAKEKNFSAIIALTLISKMSEFVYILRMEVLKKPIFTKRQMDIALKHTVTSTKNHLCSVMTMKLP